jgi:hypothetical protein
MNLDHPTLIVHCTSAVAPVCGDNLSFPVYPEPILPVTTPMQFDPAGNYLFITDISIHSVVIAKVDRKRKVIKETGSFIPGIHESLLVLTARWFARSTKRTSDSTFSLRLPGLITAHGSVS